MLVDMPRRTGGGCGMLIHHVKREGQEEALRSPSAMLSWGSQPSGIFAQCRDQCTSPPPGIGKRAETLPASNRHLSVTHTNLYFVTTGNFRDMCISIAHNQQQQHEMEVLEV
jgi:hypothetical protein